MEFEVLVFLQKTKTSKTLQLWAFFGQADKAKALYSKATKLMLYTKATKLMLYTKATKLMLYSKSQS
jgi:hypothetical protein